MQQPKTINRSYRTRNIPVGKERRLNAVKKTLEHQPHFPKSVVYEDIDKSIYDWVDKKLDISYMGRKLPTYKLFSSQRLSEYAQMWQDIDENGNININFKTLTRESNPQHGEIQGNNYNIPGNREYIIFKTTEIEEKGDEVTQIYTMKQPFAVNLIYKVNIITSSYELLNKMNIMVQNEFKSLEQYIFPNGFAMPMLLDGISDESDYTIDDKKYYGQSYQIKVMAYIIKEDDYNVKKVPSRMRNQFVVGENSKQKIKKSKFDIGVFDESVKLVSKKVDNSCISEEKIEIQHYEPDFNDLYNPTSGRNEITIEDYIGENTCWEGTENEIKVNKKVIITIPVYACDNTSEFQIDCDLELEEISINNVRKMTLFINDEEVHIDNSDVSFSTGDKIKLLALLKDVTKDGEISLICYDPHTIIDETEEVIIEK